MRGIVMMICFFIDSECSIYCFFQVIEILKLQLLGLKYQLKSCRSEIRRNVRKDLRSKANEWRLARQGLNLPVSEPYVDCLLDILNNRTLVFPECDEM